MYNLFKSYYVGKFLRPLTEYTGYRFLLSTPICVGWLLTHKAMHSTPRAGGSFIMAVIGMNPNGHNVSSRYYFSI